MMAYVFGDYAVKLWGLPKGAAVLFALGAVGMLSLLNILGIVLGKGTQNLLTAAKVLGLAGILVAGLFWGDSRFASETFGTTDSSILTAALVPVFFTYGGWNDAAFVAAELRNRRRNIPLALIIGTLGVTVIYLLVNGAYLMGLGFDGVRNSDAVAADLLKLPLREWGSDWGIKAMCLLVMVSALGAVNGLIFTSSRIYAALGSEHTIFAALGRWHPKLGSPVWSLLSQAAITLIMIVAVGSRTGRKILDRMFTSLGLESVSWQGLSGFFTLLQCTAPIFWAFFLLSALSLFVLRVKDRGMERAFSVPLFPLIPLIFTVTCAYMLYSGIQYAGKLGWVGAFILLAGLPLYLLSKRRPAPGEVA
jgi:amino acid transporter